MNMDKPLDFYIGKRVVLRHGPTREMHSGFVKESGENGLIILMDDSARMFFDKNLILDTEQNTRWTLVKVEKK